jgi:hypothetical protein
MTHPDIDHHGGYAMYQNDRIIARIYYHHIDHKTFFSVVPETDTPEEFVDMIWKSDECSYTLIDNLTGTQIPNDKYFISYVYPCNYYRLCLSIGQKQKNISYSNMFKNWFFSVVRGVVYCGHLLRYEKWARKQLLQKVEKHLTTQRIAVIDLQRGCYSGTNRDGTNGYFPLIDVTSKYPDDFFVPLKKEFFSHVESFILALPAQGKSSYYHELRSTIAPEKVVELVLFEPLSLDDFLIYKNVKKISLLEADGLVSFKGIDSFKHLEHIFITLKQMKYIESFNLLTEKIKVNISIGLTNKNQRKYTKFYNGQWYPYPMIVPSLENPESNMQTK